MRVKHISRTALTMIFAGMIFPATASATTTLTYSDHEPLGGMRTQFIHDVFFPAIEKESAGRLKIDAHWGSELATGQDVLRKVGKTGGVDMATVVPEYSAEALPLHQLFKSFPIGPSGAKQVAFFRQVYAQVPAFPAELQKQNVVDVMLTTGFPVAFFSTTPIQNILDVKGKKWRTASFWHQDFLRNAGAAPVTLPWGPKVSDALKNRTLDGLMVNSDSGIEINAQEAAPYVLASKDLWLGHVYLLVMNKTVWDGLAKDDQQAIQRAAASSYQSLGPLMDSRFTAMMAKMESEGVNIRTLTPQEAENWKTISQYQQVQADWVKAQEAKGVKNASQTLKQLTGLMKETLAQ
ncbi:ABC transporter substrate-binding protein [Chimaeribacter coloradensis]|uniref:ABC transporter substrate-binding protein n=2 Tax=Chimaeribacter coloradensis TaxID=2060068 RepID=A0A2N5E7Q3_9GAMM|nr:ABC transporter substrate-binding protein [Chimaeribacter coloradensis]